MTGAERVKWAGGLGIGVTLVLFVVSWLVPLDRVVPGVDLVLAALLFPALTVGRVFGFANRLPSGEGCFVIFVSSVIFYAALAWLVLSKPWRRLRGAAARRS
jgi:hypothetical protein